jgi:hypothetical protein
MKTRDVKSRTEAAAIRDLAGIDQPVGGFHAPRDARAVREMDVLTRDGGHGFRLEPAARDRNLDVGRLDVRVGGLGATPRERESKEGTDRQCGRAETNEETPPHGRVLLP